MVERTHLNPLNYVVVDYDTGEVYTEPPTYDLIRASRAYGPDGTVSAYRNPGSWEYAGSASKRALSAQGHALHTVVVRKA